MPAPNFALHAAHRISWSRELVPDLLAATYEFMQRSGQLQNPGVSDHDERHGWLAEEWHEYLAAVEERDEAALVDGLLDIIVVAWGTLLQRYGAHGAGLLAAEVARSNLDKLAAGVNRSADGRVLKPAGWVGPRIGEVLATLHSAARQNQEP